MLAHDDLRTAMFTTLKDDPVVNDRIEAWYRLVVPKAIRAPFVAITSIFQPTTGISGTATRRTRRDRPIDVTVDVVSEKHDVDDADEGLGDAYIAVYDCLCDNHSLGITGLKFVNIDILTRPMGEYGIVCVGAEFTVSYIYNTV